MVSYLGVVRTVMMADTAQFNRAVTGASMQFRAAATKMRTDAQGLAGIGGALNLAITIPALFATRAIVKMGSEYETQMMKIRNATDMTDKTMKAFLATQKGIAKSTNTSRTSLAEIGYIAAQGQISSPKALAAFQKSVAKAQHILPGDASDVVVAEGFRSIINAFKLSANEFEPTMAKLVKTINLGSISWQEYAKTISFVTSIASATKTPESLQNMNMAMAVVTHEGGQTGRRAAKSLRALYDTIYKNPGKQAKALASSLGYNDLPDMFERGAGSDLIRFMKLLPKQIRNMEGVTKLGVTRTAKTTALALANAPDKVIEDYRARYARAPEDFDKQFEDAKQNTAFKLKAFSNAWKELKLSFSEALGPWLLKGLEALTYALNAMADSPASLKRLAGGLVALASAISIVKGIQGAIATITLPKRLAKLLADQPVPALDSNIDHSGGVARIAAARIAAARLAKAEAAAAITESRLRQTLSKEREYAERAILKAKKAEAITAAKQAGDAARAAVVSQQLQAAILQAKASAAGFTMPGYRGAMGRHPPGFVRNLFRSKRLIGAPPPPLFPFMPDRMAYTPGETSWHGLTMPNYTGPRGRNVTIDMVQLPDGSFGRRLQRPLLGEYGTGSRPRVDTMSSIPGARFYNAMYRPRSMPRMPRMPSMGGTWGAIGGAMTRQRTMPSLGEGGQMAAIGGLLVVLSQMALILEDTIIPALNGFGIPVSSLSELFSGLVTTVGVMLVTLTGVIQALSQTWMALGAYIGITFYNAFKKIGRAFEAFADWYDTTWFGAGHYTPDELEARKAKREQEAAADKLVARDALRFAGQSALGIYGIGPESVHEERITNYLERRRRRNAVLDTGGWGANPAGSPMGGAGPSIDETLHDAQVQARESFQTLVEELSGMLSGGHSIGGAPGLFEAGTQEGYKALIQSNDSLLQVMTTLKEKTERFLSRIDDAGHDTATTLDAIHEFLKRQQGVTP